MRYFEKLKIRNKIEVEKDGYTAYYYEDYFLGEWVGNANVFKGEKNLLHATLSKPYTKKDLENLIDWVKKEIKI